MKSQLRSFPLKELKDNTFVFTVSENFEYLIKFHLSQFHLPASIQDIHLYEFSFVARNKPDQAISHIVNEKIRNTIFEAVDYFISRTDAVLVFICDSSDRRDLVRYKLFTERWYHVAIDQYTVEMVHRVIEDQELGDVYYTGVLMKKDFEYYDELIDEFGDIKILNK